MGDLTVVGIGVSKRLYLRRRMYVPSNENLHLFLLQQHHDPPAHGHPGFKSMLRKLQENWFWIGMANGCKQYATNCATCRRTKAYNTKKQGLLNPLPIPNRKWLDLSLDFVVQLPECRRRNHLFQHILVVVDRLTKQRIYEPLESLSTSEFIDAMYRRVFSTYGYPLSIVSDRGGQMISTLWKWLCQRYGINVKLSSAQHPETDGQMENANKVMKNYLRAYISHMQDD